ncbi:MAG: type IX secretion system outer membrane channel protein PorV [Chitinophagaceae bacterium]
MKQTRLKTTAVFLFSFGIIISSFAQSTINVVSTAVPFLRISPDARAGGMGDVGIATTPDANSNFWNLGKIPFAEAKTAASLTYSPWLKDIAPDIFLVTLAGYHQLDEEQAISASIRYFNLGQIQFTDFNGNSLGQGRPREFAIDFGYSRKLSDKLGVGVALRYINSSLVSGDVGGTVYKPGQTVAADLSLYHNGLDENGQGFSWGIALSNLGGKVGYTDNALSKDFIPANAGIGGAYTAVLDEDNKITFGVDFNKLLVPSLPYDPNATDSANQAALDAYHGYSVFQSWFKSFNNNAYTFAGGAEYTYNNQFSVRAGYFFEPQSQGGRKYATVGVGLKYQAFGFNFSYLVPSGNGVTRNPLSNTLRFGIIFNLDNVNANNGQ